MRQRMGFHGILWAFIGFCGMTAPGQIDAAAVGLAGGKLHLHVGALAGPQYLKVRSILDDKKQTKKSTLGAEGVLAGAHLTGFYQFSDAFKLGLDLNGLWGTAKATYKDFGQAQRRLLIRARESFGASLSPLYCNKDIAVGPTIGFVHRAFKATMTSHCNGSGAWDKHKAGFALGAIMNYQMCDRLSLGLGFQHVWYPAFSFGTTGAGTPTYQNNTISLKPSFGTALVRLSYVL